MEPTLAASESSSATSSTTSWTMLLLLMAAFCAGIATLCRFGRFLPLAFWCMAAAFALALAAMVVPKRALLRYGQETLLVCFGAGLAVFAGVSLWNFPPIIYLHGDLNSFRLYWLLTGIMVGPAGMAVFATARITRILFAVILACFLSLGFWVLLYSPAPVIDVWVAHQYSCQALCEGKNPFSISYPDVYGPKSTLIAPGTVKEGLIQAGYPYPPLTLLMSLPGYLLGDDHRYANLFAIALTALALAFTGRERVGALAAIVLLMMPHTLFVLEQAWTEAHILLLLVAFALCSLRAPKVAPWIFGLFLVSKQHLPMAAPLALLVLPKPFQLKPALLYFGKALLAGAIVTLPFVLWDVSAFDHSVLAIFHAAPEKMMQIRPDSVTFFAAGLYYNIGQLPSISHFVALGVIMLLCLVINWKSRTPVASCIASIALANLAMFSFSHHAFANHYYLIFGALLCAVAAESTELDRDALALPAK